MWFFICIFAIKKWALSEGTFPILDFLNVWFIKSKVKVLSWNLKNNITREACSLKLSCNTEHGLFFTIKRIGINQHTYSLHDMIVFHKITFFEYFFYYLNKLLFSSNCETKQSLFMLQECYECYLAKSIFLNMLGFLQKFRFLTSIFYCSMKKWFLDMFKIRFFLLQQKPFYLIFLSTNMNEKPQQNKFVQLPKDDD